MMWSTALSNLFILPILLLVSIPLALSASVTAFLATITLFIRASVVYFELSIALLVNFFLFPAHSPVSDSFLALSEGATPGVDRMPSSRTKQNHHYHNQVNAQHLGIMKPRRESWSSKEVVEDYFFHNHNHLQYGPGVVHSREVISSFVSGNAERDFEGVGGWRTPLPSRKKHQTSSASSLSYNSSEEELLDDDDQAWLSINKRLELPSRQLNMASPTLSPVMLTTATAENSEQQARHYHHYSHHHQQITQQQPQRPKFHRRSKTTPLFSEQRPTSMISTSPLREEQIHRTQLHTSKSSGGLESMPSSSLPRPSTSHGPFSSSSSLTTSPTWYEPPLLMTTIGLGGDYRMVHYPTSVSRRRRSSGSPSAAAKAMSLTGLGLT